MPSGRVDAGPRSPAAVLVVRLRHSVGDDAISHESISKGGNGRPLLSTAVAARTRAHERGISAKPSPLGPSKP